MADGASGNDKAAAQQPPITLDAEAEALRLAAYKASQRAAIAKSQTEALGDSTAAPKTGSVDVDATGGASLVNVVAAKALTEAASRIAGNVAAKAEKSRPVLLVQSPSIASSQTLHTEVTAKLKAWETSLGKVQEALAQEEGADRSVTIVALLAAVPVVVEFTKVLIDFLGLFETDFTMSGRTVVIDRRALEAEVSRNLMAAGFTVLLPDLALAKASSVLATYETLLETRRGLEGQIAKKELDLKPLDIGVEQAASLVTELQSRLAAGLGAGGLSDQKLELISNELKLARNEYTKLANNVKYKNLKLIVSTARSIVTAFDVFGEAVTRVPDGSSHSALTAAALQAKVIDLNPGSILYVDLAASGADVISKKGNLDDGRIAFLAGLQAYYLLASPEGALLDSAAFSEAAGVTYNVGGIFAELDVAPLGRTKQSTAS